MTAPETAVLLIAQDGAICAQNRSAQQLLGRCTGERCRDVLTKLTESARLPCTEDCTRQLVAAGIDRPASASFRHGGQRHRLSCVPVGDNVVCSLTPAGTARPAAWQSLTARELSVLELLAAGETTGSAARQLGLSTSTVRTHVEKLRLKLGASTQAAVVARGYQLGYLS